MEILNIESLGYLGEVIKKCAEDAAQRKFTEMFEDYEANRKFENSTINSDELCERWECCKNSLRNMEKDGIIAPLPVGGRKKVYSMQDVLYAEAINPKLNRARA